PIMNSQSRPIFLEIQALTDTDLSIMCETRRIFIGPINAHTRRIAERQLHVAMVEERAIYRAQQQYQRELHTKYSDFPSDTESLRSMPRLGGPKRTYWPEVGSHQYRRHLPPSSEIYKLRKDPVLEDHKKVPWQGYTEEQDKKGPNILGFQVPFSLSTARNFGVRVGEALRRFQGGLDAITDFDDNVEQENYELEDQREAFRTNQSHSKLNNYRDWLKNSHIDKDRYLDCRKESELAEAYQATFNVDAVNETFSQKSDYEYHLDSTEDTFSQTFDNEDHLDLEVDLSNPRLVPSPDRQSHSDFDSLESTTTLYHDFPKSEPLVKAVKSSCITNIFRWWWRRQKVLDGTPKLKFQRIPESERTQEGIVEEERVLKTINYLDEAQAAQMRKDDGVLELMSRVQLRDDSEMELDPGLRIMGHMDAVGDHPGDRSIYGFCRHIYRLMFDGAGGYMNYYNLRCSVLCGCLAVSMYMCIKLMR
ncbi:hypothetical protein KR018_010604, partial [Drosophila ironensis]